MTPKLTTIKCKIQNWHHGSEMAPPIPATRSGFGIPQDYKMFGDQPYLIGDSGCEDEDRILLFCNTKRS